MPSSTESGKTPTTPTSNETVTTLSLVEVLRALGLAHAASLLESATGKAITRQESPTSGLDRSRSRRGAEVRDRNAA
jgi:hypothetical protein